MKTLLLTSEGSQIKTEILKLLPKPYSQIKVAQIITAAKGENDSSYVAYYKKELENIGLQVESIDIQGKNEAELRGILHDKNVIYVEGGNTFYLMKYVRESGFDKVVKDLITKGVIYIGVSAGSIIATPSIEIAGWKNIDRNKVGLTDLSGLNLVPFMIFPHFEEKYTQLLKEEIPKSPYPVKILSDDQAILIRDNKWSLVGKGREITI